MRETPPEPPQTVQLTPAAQSAAVQTARDFVRTAVLRRHVERSWALTAQRLRQGLTRKQWATGNIPVIPYPAAALREARWRVDTSGRDRLALEVLLVPKPSASVRPLTFELELEAVGPPQRRRWLVSGWNPSGGLASARPLPGSGLLDLRGRDGGRPLGAAWLLAPVALLLAVLLVPAWIFGRSWRKGHRARREFRSAAAR